MNPNPGSRVYIEDKIMNLSYEIEEIHRHEEEEKNIAYFLTKKYKPLLFEYYEKLSNSEDNSEIIDYCQKYIDIFNEVNSYYEEGKDNSALYELFEILDKNIVQVWCKLGLAYYNFKDYEFALETFEYALGFEVKELEANIHFYIGSCYFELEDYQNAYENSKKAYELDKDNSEAKKLAELAFAKLTTPQA